MVVRGMSNSGLKKGAKILLLVSVCIASACRAPQKKKTLPDLVEDKSPVFLFEQIRKNQLDYTWFSSKISAHAEVGKTTHSFSASIRCRKDSVIWMSITSMLGIEVLRLYITPDSVKYINRLASDDSRYFEGDFSAIRRLLKLDMDVDYPFIQAALTGNYTSENPDSVFKATTHPKFYNLGTVNRHRLKKTMGNEEEFSIVKQDIRIEPEHFRIIRLVLNDLTLNRKFETRYDDFTEIEGQWFPSTMEVEIHATDKSKVRITHSKITLNKPQRFPFKQPDE